MEAATRDRKGRRRSRLDRERIVDAALEVVDDVGLPGLNMRRLAAQVGTKPMSLYRHIANKDELLDAIAERVVGQLTIPDLTAGDAFGNVMDVVRAFRSKLLEHPNALPLFTGARAAAGTLVQLDALEAVLRGADATGIDPTTALEALAIVLAFVLGSVVREVTASGAFGVTPDVIGPQKDAGALPPDRFPHLVALAEDFPAENFDDLFERGLRALVAGLLMSLPEPRPTKTKGTR